MKGMPIIARMNCKVLGIANNSTYKIKVVDDEYITIIEPETNLCMEIETKNFTMLFNLAYCITTHCAQGQTYDHPYSIYEFNRMDSR